MYSYKLAMTKPIFKSYNGFRPEIILNSGVYPFTLISSTRRSKKALYSSGVLATPGIPSSRYREDKGQHKILSWGRMGMNPTSHATSQMAKTFDPEHSRRVPVLFVLRTRPIRKWVWDCRYIFITLFLHQTFKLLADVDIHASHLGRPDLGKCQFVLLGVSLPKLRENPLAFNELKATSRLQHISEVAHNTRPLRFFQSPHQETLMNYIKEIFPLPAVRKWLEEVMLAKIEVRISQE